MTLLLLAACTSTPVQQAHSFEQTRQTAPPPPGAGSPAYRGEARRSRSVVDIDGLVSADGDGEDVASPDVVGVGKTVHLHELGQRDADGLGNL